MQRCKVVEWIKWNIMQFNLGFRFKRIFLNKLVNGLPAQEVSILATVLETQILM